VTGSTADRLRAALVADYVRTEGATREDVEASVPPADFVFRWALEAVRPLVREALRERQLLAQVRSQMLSADWPASPQPAQWSTARRGHRVLRGAKSSRTEILALLAKMDNDLLTELQARQTAALEAVEMPHRKHAPRPRPRGR